MKQLNCSTCGGNCVKTKNQIYGKSELGFSIPTKIYRCESCGKEFMICPICNGDKFEESDHSIHDCETCHGMGVIEMEAVYE